MIYIHVPFCHRRCIYCAFYSTANSRLIEAYVDALQREITQRSAEMRHSITSLYFGGGTPSAIGTQALGNIMHTLHQCFDLHALQETTIECNPEDIDPTFAADIKRLGFNRVSLGVQSLDDTMLRTLGRRHTAAQAVAAIDTLHGSGITNIGIDLIYGLPSLDAELWLQTLRQATALNIKHISAYALTVEPGTALQRLVDTGRMPLPTDDVVHQQYRTLCQVLEGCGYEHYEVSNFAKPGYRSLHNSRYWDHTPYIGLGPAAHSYSDNRRWWNSADLEAYIATHAHEGELLDPTDLRNESLMTGLRCDIGIERNLVQHKQMQPYIEQGWIRATEQRYLPTDEGMFHADGMACALFS